MKCHWKQNVIEWKRQSHKIAGTPRSNIYKSSLLGTWGRNFHYWRKLQCWISVNTDKFCVFTNFDIKKRKWTKIFVFNAELYVLMFRRPIFSNKVDRFKWFELCKNTTHLPSLKSLNCMGHSLNQFSSYALQ